MQVRMVIFPGDDGLDVAIERVVQAAPDRRASRTEYALSTCPEARRPPLMRDKSTHEPPKRVAIL
jgi:hypothetical protein